MLKSSIAIAALMIGAPMAFAQGAPNADKGGAGAGMSDRSSHERMGGASGASEGSSGSNYAPGHEKGSGPANERAPGSMKSEGSAREYAPGHEKDRTGKQSESRSDRDRDMQRNRADRSERNSDRNARGDRDSDMKNRNASGDRDRNRNEARGEDRGGASSGASQGTEGRAEGHRGSIASVTTEQRSRARSAFSSHRVAPVRDLGVAVNVGVRLPRTVHLYPVPLAVVEIVPAYREYEYIQIDDNRIAIIDPDTFEVVDIIVLA